jgi:uncharacterized membrane protein
LGKGRVEAFSDGVIAILITIMVLELKVPHGEDWSALEPLVPVFLAYVLSFIYVGIYWNNHHHMFHAVRHVNGSILWANLHLLFWLSLVPAVTAWLDHAHFATAPTLLYGVVLLMAGGAYKILQNVIIASQGKDSVLKRAVGADHKGSASLACYLLAIVLAFRWPAASLALYAIVALMWLVPDRRIERVIEAAERS